MQIIVHTHWDREWFVTEEYTTYLLSDFFQKLFKLIEKNPNYRFTLDGQTLMIDDHLKTLKNPEKERFTKQLHSVSENLFVGPYYGQIDWRMSEEASIMNLLLGKRRAKELTGAVTDTGWLVDNFGFCSQVPQIHKLFGIDSLFLWRGFDPGNHPCTEAKWHGSDGSEVLLLYLLDSYRNLMRISEYPEVAEQRLEEEVSKLGPCAKTHMIPLLDGYDLDPEPEDPSTLLELKMITPDEYARAVIVNLQSDLHEASGELISGRLVSTFPGTLSTRGYLKLMNWSCEYTLSRVVGPLVAASCSYESTEIIRSCWELLLQNLVHDSICGVGVDQVHEEMEDRYESVLGKCKEVTESSLRSLSAVLPNGYSFFNLNPSPSEVAFGRPGGFFRVTCGPGRIGSLNPRIYPYEVADEDAEGSQWQNEYFTALVEDGRIVMRRKDELLELFPQLVRDSGDEYSAELSDTIDLKLESSVVEKRSKVSSEVLLDYTSEVALVQMRLIFSDLPTVLVDFTVDGIGEGYAVLLTLRKSGE